MFCALFRLSNNTALSKKAIFHWFCLPQVVHKRLWVRWEIEQLLIGKSSQKYSDQKLLKFDNPSSSYNRKCSGSFLRHSVYSITSQPLSILLFQILSLLAHANRSLAMSKAPKRILTWASSTSDKATYSRRLQFPPHQCVKHDVVLIQKLLAQYSFYKQRHCIIFSSGSISPEIHCQHVAFTSHDNRMQHVESFRQRT